MSTSIATAINESAHVSKHIAELKQHCREIAATNPGDTFKLFGDLHGMVVDYYEGALKQANRSFWAALGCTVSGTGLFVWAIWMSVKNGAITEPAWVSLIAAAITQVISALNLHLYKKATAQLELFHVCLERSARYLMASSILENFHSEEEQDKTREQLVTIMANAELLPIAGANAQRPTGRRRKTAGLAARKAQTTAV